MMILNPGCLLFGAIPSLKGGKDGSRSKRIHYPVKTKRIATRVRICSFTCSDNTKRRYTCEVEPLCKLLQIDPSGYRRYAVRQRNPQLLCNRAKREPVLMLQMQRVRDQNMRVYEADKVRRALPWEQQYGACCTVERLMRHLSI